MSNLVLAETIPMPEHSDDFSQLDEIELLKRLTMGSMGNVSLANIKRALDSDAGSVTNANIVRARDAIEMARLLTEKLAARRMEGRIVTAWIGTSGGAWVPVSGCFFRCYSF